MVTAFPPRSLRLAATGLALSVLIGGGPARAQSPDAEPRHSLVVEGKTEPYRNLLIKSPGRRNPPWSSEIHKIHVEEGDRVTRGQVLLEFEDDFEKLEVEMRREIAEHQASIQNARDRESALKNLWDDAQKAFEGTKTISREEVRRREVSYLAAVSDRLRLEATKQREVSEWKMAQAALERQKIRSPIDGSVLQIFLREGESAGTGDSLLRIVDTSRGLLVGDVEEPVGRTLVPGQKVSLQIRTGATVLPTEGVIQFVSPIVDPASGLMPVKVEFQNAEGMIRPGVSGSLLLDVAPAP